MVGVGGDGGAREAGDGVKSPEGDAQATLVRELEAKLSEAYAALETQQAEGERLALELADALCKTQGELAASQKALADLQASSREKDEALAVKAKELVASEQRVACLRQTVCEANASKDKTSRGTRG